MNKTAQNLTWNCLPLEVKQEVKRQYQIATDAKEYFTECTLEYLFGSDNLTSDAEGEVELLYVTRQKVMGLYANAKKLHDLYTSATCINTTESQQIDICTGTMSVLTNLFGSKCLPDDTKDGTKDDTKDDTKEPKPAEPKFKCGGRVRIVKQNHPQYGKTATVDTLVRGTYPEILVNLGGNLISFDESDLEPYTEPQPTTECSNSDKEPPTCTDDCPSPCPSQDFDTILKDSFSKERRLNIAAMVTQGIMANPSPQMVEMDVHRVAVLAVLMADDNSIELASIIGGLKGISKLNEIVERYRNYHNHVKLD